MKTDSLLTGKYSKLSASGLFVWEHSTHNRVSFPVLTGRTMAITHPFGWVITRWSSPLERFCAGHFTCKNTDWEKWREPIRKVVPETTDWALHTRIPVRIEPSLFLTAAECWSIAGSEDTQSGIFYFSVSFFSPFPPFVSGRWSDLGVLRRLQTCFRLIDLFILFIFFICHATVDVVVVVIVVVVTGFVLKRLFASVATVCLKVGTSAVKHHRSFLEYMYYTPFSVTSKVGSKLSKLIRSWRR